MAIFVFLLPTFNRLSLSLYFLFKDHPRVISLRSCLLNVFLDKLRFLRKKETAGFFGKRKLRSFSLPFSNRSSNFQVLVLFATLSLSLSQLSFSILIYISRVHLFSCTVYKKVTFNKIVDTDFIDNRFSPTHVTNVTYKFL